MHLAHVIANPRTPYAGLTRAALMSTWDEGDEDGDAVMAKLEREARSMLSSRYAPIVRAAGVACDSSLLRLDQGRSAAAIGELLAGAAARLGGGVLVIASHGPGVRAEFGSVARWCQDHSSVPVMLLPPAVLKQAGDAAGSPQQPQQQTGSVVVVAGPVGEDLARLKLGFDVATKRLARAGDELLLVNIVGAGDGSEERLVAARRGLIAAAGDWQRGATGRLAATLKLACDVLPDASASTASFDEGGSRAGTALCSLAARSGARAVVLLRHGADLAQELQFAPLTAYVIKNCARPLVVLDPSLHLMPKKPEFDFDFDSSGTGQSPEERSCGRPESGGPTAGDEPRPGQESQQPSRGAAASP